MKYSYIPRRGRTRFIERLWVACEDYLWDWKYQHPTQRRSFLECWKGAAR